MASQVHRESVREKLRAAGQWSAFTDACKGHRKSGMTFDQAWAEGEKEFAAYLPAEKPVEPPAIVTGEKKEISERDSIRWVFENLAPYRAGRVKPEDAPSGGAWGLLMWVNASKANESDFYRSIWPKTVPARSKLEDEGDGYGDDGREQLAILERLIGAQAAAVLPPHS